MNTTTTIEFNLAEIVRDVVDNSDAVDPRVLADEVMEFIEPEHYEAVIRKILPDYVRRFATRPSTKPGPTSSPVPNHQDDGTQESHVGNGGTPPPPPPSNESHRWRNAGRWARKRVALGTDAEREWKYLADLTREDCLKAAKIRFDNSTANLIEAKKYEQLAEALQPGQIVGDLSTEVVDGIMS